MHLFVTPECSSVTQRDIMNRVTFIYACVYICICDTQHPSVSVHWERFKKKNMKFWTQCDCRLLLLFLFMLENLLLYGQGLRDSHRLISVMCNSGEQYYSFLSLDSALVSKMESSAYREKMRVAVRVRPFNRVSFCPTLLCFLLYFTRLPKKYI